MRGMN